MTQNALFRVLSVRQDYRGGALDNARFEGADLCIHALSPGCSGFAVSPLIDSLEQGMIWHRIRVSADIPVGAGLELYVYASDERVLLLDGEGMDIADFIGSGASVPHMISAMRPYLRLTCASPEDQLLHAVQGRYLWFVLRLGGQERLTPAVRSVRVEFPRQSLLSWLPEVYQSDEDSAAFLTQYLAVFGTLMGDLEERIDTVSTLFDAQLCPSEFLAWLSGWLAVEDPQLWDEQRLRRLLSRCMALYRLRGTRRGIEEMVELYTGTRPFVVEASDTLGEAETAEPERAELLRRLYGEHPNTVTVIVSEEGLPTQKEVRELDRILSAIRPAHTKVSLVVLHPYIFLDQYAYLSENSRLFGARALRLDGYGALPYVALLGETTLKKEGTSE